MKLPAIYRRWLPQAKFTTWAAILPELERKLKEQEEDLKMLAEAQEWTLNLGPDPFLTLREGLVIKPRPRGSFDKRKPGGSWSRLDPRCDIPENDLITWQMCGEVFTQIVEMRQAVKDLPAAVAEYKDAFEQRANAARAADSKASRQGALAQLQDFCEENKEFLPQECGKALLELEKPTPANASHTLVDAPRIEPVVPIKSAPPPKVEPPAERIPPSPSPGLSEDEILAEAANCAHAAAPGEVEKLMEAHPHLREDLQPLLERAQKRFELIPEAMTAADGGNFLKMAEIYSGDLEYAENLMVFLESAFTNFLARTVAQKDWVSTPAALEALRLQHREVERTLRQLQNLERAPARIKLISGFARENSAALKVLEALQPELSKKAKESGQTGTKTKTRSKTEARGQTGTSAKARGDGETGTSARTARRRKEEASAGEGKKSIDEKRASLASWAGVQEEQYVHLAIVFTDIIGSTALNSRFGDATWDTIRSAHFTQARSILEKLHGWYIKDVGDAVVAVFKNAVDALTFAMDLEKSTGHEMVRIKAAAHIGTVIIRGNDIFGNEVNLAARIQHQAGDGGIWMSEGVRAEWRSRHGKNTLSFTRHPDVQLRGLDEPITLWSVPPTIPLPELDTGKTETKRIKKEKSLTAEKASASTLKDGRDKSDGSEPGKNASGFGFGSIGRMFGTMISRKPEATPPLSPVAAKVAKVLLDRADQLAKQARADEIGQMMLQNPSLQKELRRRRESAESLQSEILAKASLYVDKAKPDEIKKLERSYPYVPGLKGLAEAARRAGGKRER